MLITDEEWVLLIIVCTSNNHSLSVIIVRRPLVRDGLVSAVARVARSEGDDACCLFRADMEEEGGGSDAYINIYECICKRPNLLGCRRGLRVSRAD